MACQAASVLLQQVEADGQDAAQHMRQATTQLQDRSTQHKSITLIILGLCQLAGRIVGRNIQVCTRASQ